MIYINNPGVTLTLRSSKDGRKIVLHHGRRGYRSPDAEELLSMPVLQNAHRAGLIHFEAQLPSENTKNKPKKRGWPKGKPRGKKNGTSAVTATNGISKNDTQKT